ncbi:MAG: chromate transporter [bacterium]|nr:chromate transporter [bacterium]
MLWKIFLSFLKVGTFGFGSGPAMVVLIEREMVDMGLMTTTEITDAVALSTCLPGPLATKMALFCGYTAAGYIGAIVAMLAMLLPSTVALLVLVKFVQTFRDQPRMTAALRALRPVVVAIFLFLAFNSGRNMRFGWDSIALCVVALTLLILKVEPAWIVFGAIIMGLLFY